MRLAISPCVSNQGSYMARRGIGLAATTLWVLGCAEPADPTRDLDRRATQQGGVRDTQPWLIGDFNGDGKLEPAETFNDGGLISIDVHVSNGSTFALQRWATQQGGFWDTQQWLAADFNGDGKTDLAKVFDDGGLISIDAHISTGSSFSTQRWATQQGELRDPQQWLAGDFDGDGKADLASITSDGGQISIDAHISTGSSFSIQRWATQRGGFWDTQASLAGATDGPHTADLNALVDETIDR